ncbi:MAG: hypothetical protein KDE27_20780 [Planctomycetes bacterium]|nr:hypothetical protein [Planctomycetota bacterium]
MRSPQRSFSFVVSTSRAAFATLAVSVAASAQATLLVGPNQAYATITSAVAASAPGDTVMVLGGTYAEDIVVDHGIQLVGRGAVLTATSDLLVHPMVRIHDLPAGQSFVMLGFEVQPVVVDLMPTRRTLAIEDCLGTVAVANLTTGYYYARWNVEVTRSPQVHLRASRLGNADLTGSEVMFEDCVVGSTALSLGAIRATDSRTTIVGGSIGDTDSHLPSPAVVASAGELRVTRAVLRGAVAFGMSGPAIQATNAALHLDPSTMLQVSGSTAPIAGSHTLDATELVSTIAAYGGSSLQLRSHGPAGDLFAIVVGPPAAPTITTFGLAWLDPAAIALLSVANFGVDRAHTLQLGMPPLPPGLTAAFALVHFGAGGPALGEPSMLSVP